MAPPKGNQFWKLRAKHGRDKLFETASLLLESAEEYFQWCDDNPWMKVDYKGSDVLKVEIPTQRPYSKMGWFAYIGCSDTWLTEFKKTANDDFLKVIKGIEAHIATQQWEGATVGAFNANIIARTLGLRDKTDITSDEKPLSSGPFKVEIVQPEED